MITSLFLLLLSFSTHAAEHGCEDGLRAWAEFVRFPERGKPDQTYVDQQRRAQTFFVHWYVSIKRIRPRNLMAMLKTAHRMALRRGYRLQALEGSLSVSIPNEVRAGVPRVGNIPPIAIGKYLPEHEKQILFAKREPSYAEDDYGVSSWRPQLIGLPADAPPRVTSWAKTDVRDPYQEVQVLVAHASQFALYATRMAELLTQLRTVNNSEERLFLIAQYYQLGVCMHVFEGVNNSLLMGQVNGLLKLHGHAPLAHGYLDFMAFALRSERFFAYFRERVNAADQRL